MRGHATPLVHVECVSNVAWTSIVFFGKGGWYSHCTIICGSVPRCLMISLRENPLLEIPPIDINSFIPPPIAGSYSLPSLPDRRSSAAKVSGVVSTRTETPTSTGGGDRIVSGRTSSASSEIFSSGDKRKSLILLITSPQQASANSGAICAVLTISINW